MRLQEFEESHPLAGKPVVEEDGGAKRREAVARLVALGRALGLHEECIHDSVQLLDRLSRMGLARDTLAPSVLGAIALISAKQGALSVPSVPLHAYLPSKFGKLNVPLQTGIAGFMNDSACPAWMMVLQHVSFVHGRYKLC